MTFDVDGFLTLLRQVRAQENRVIYAPSYSRTLHEPVEGSHRISPFAKLVISNERSLPPVVTEEEFVRLQRLERETLMTVGNRNIANVTSPILAPSSHAPALRYCGRPPLGS